MSRIEICHKTLHQQLLSLKRRYPHGKGEVKQHQLIWYCDLRLGDPYGTYRIKVTYKLNSAPSVFVISPNLYEITSGETPPHIYTFTQDKIKLCLFLPGSGEWNRNKFLSDTVVPWASLWLIYFNGWLATNEWYGGGEHPNVAESYEQRREL
ncbi:hypothetical protein MHM93_17330 [Pseudoalteromonas sp. MM17-2]|uniref:hypothetical protein n=1 Tax=Pseudoalteromonas sp. MM17-2 TaxID=2917753 RepID=UPI001EF4F98F|nr:hypothetical protein [Pseudoalteromonas sp. MM17-2]MCG7545946.1 hypothetical protein [Pseudoalteromonas sp. MM17-2]